MPGLLADFISVTNPTGAEPVPNSALMNDTQNFTVSVRPNTTYFLRLANIGAFAGQYFWIEGHNMTIIEVDGVYTEPAETDMIYLTAAQRYGVLITTRNDSSSNFAMVGSMDTVSLIEQPTGMLLIDHQDLFDQVPEALNPNVTGWLVYDHDVVKPSPAVLDAFAPFDDYTLVPQDGLEIYSNVDYSFNLDLKMDNLGDGAN